MSDKDASGSTQVGKNVLTSWASYVVFVVFGFVMPRMIDESLGQAALGIWDFGWSVVHYLGLAMVGIGSSVNRYVARYLGSGEHDKLSRTISSVVAIQAVIAAGVGFAALLLANFVPSAMAESLGDDATVAGDVILYLGLALSVQMAADSFRGVLTGCHQWTTHNVLNASSYAITATLMMTVLFQGGGLRAIAIVFLGMTIITEIVRIRIARTACPTIEYRLDNVNRADIGKVFRFGVKNILIYLPKIIIQQTVSVMVVTSLGPAMLAVLARPIALTGHVTTLIYKFAFVLTPTTGFLQGSGRDEDLRRFATQSMQAGWILAVLPSVYLIFLGDRLIDLWMGEGYGRWSVVAILAAGGILQAATSAILTIMAGMNEHGRIAKLSLIISSILFVVGAPVVFYVGWSLELAALMIVLPSNLGIGLVAIVVGCKVLNISPREFVRDVMRKPLLVGAVCSAALLAVRFLGPQETLSSLATGAAVQGMLILMLLHSDIRDAVRSLRERD